MYAPNELHPDLRLQACYANQNHRRMAWNSKDAISGRHNFRSIGTAA